MSHALRRALGESQADLELLASHLGLIQGVLDASDHAVEHILRVCSARREH